MSTYLVRSEQTLHVSSPLSHMEEFIRIILIIAAMPFLFATTLKIKVLTWKECLVLCAVTTNLWQTELFSVDCHGHHIFMNVDLNVGGCHRVCLFECGILYFGAVFKSFCHCYHFDVQVIQAEPVLVLQ